MLTAGGIAKSAGIRFGCQNHHMEFQRVVKEEDKGKQSMPWMPPGDVICDLLLEGADPNLVFFEMDVNRIVRGGNDPLEYFEEYPGRYAPVRGHKIVYDFLNEASFVK